MNAETSTEQVVQGKSREDQEAALEEVIDLVQVVVLEMENSVDFSAATRDILSQVKDSGLSFTSFSFFLVERPSLHATHYALESLAAGSEVVLTEEMAEYHVCLTGQPRMWQDALSSEPLWYLSVPSVLGVATISAYREQGFTDVEEHFLQLLARSLDALVLRYRDLHALEMSKAKVLQTDSDLVALYDGSYNLLSEDRDRVIQKIIHLITTKLELDRAGIFLVDAAADFLRGTWGIDDQGAVVPIFDTIFPLHPESTEELSQIAQVARGELDYFLTRQLDPEGGLSVEGDIKANVCVPMRVNEQIVGVLAADNYLTDRPIGEEQIHPLTILANQGAVALEHTRLYNELQESERRLRQSQRVEAIGQLTAGVAHHFNNLLQGITGCLGEIKKQGSDAVMEWAERADSMTHRASDVVRELMLFSRQSLKNNYRSVEIADLIHDIVGACRKDFERPIDIEMKLGSVPAVLGDEAQLRQVFLNLCLNAQDALAQVADRVPLLRIDLEAVEVSAKGEERPAEIAAGSYVRVRVEDNGVGMEAEIRDHIFDPFFTTKEVGDGTGLGLSTVYGVVYQHEGWIECASEPGRGTTFSVYLPVKGTELGEAVEEGRSEAAEQTETILIVEDEMIVSSALKAGFEDCGYTVLLSVDGAEGLETFRREQDRIDLVMMDLSMPTMTGEELLPQLLALKPALKVIVFSGYPVDPEELPGIAKIVTKPVQTDDMVEILREVLDSP